MIYFTADLHLNHHNIIRYCNRPFIDIAEMNSELVNNWNTTVNESDTVYFLGDLFFKSNNFKLNGQIIYIKGNHDHNFPDLRLSDSITIQGLHIFMMHYPPWINSLKYSFTIPLKTDIILCGHVHNNWKTRTYTNCQGNIPVINVGVDVWDYKPVTIEKITKLITYI
jgi:calcineurin-like phosphoesterase family protein